MHFNIIRIKIASISKRQQPHRDDKCDLKATDGRQKTTRKSSTIGQTKNLH